MSNKKRYIKILVILFVLTIFAVYNRENIINIFEKLQNSFIRTVIDEKRYILFLEGLKSTLLISFLSIFIGSLLGFILFLLYKSRIKSLNVISYIFVRFLQ